MVALLWRVMSSQRSFALLVLLVSGATLLTVAIPQGAEALEMAKSPAATRLHELIGWGLSDVFRSPWMRALLCLVAGSFVATLYRAWPRTRAGLPVEPPEAAPHERELEAPAPETAVEALRGVYLRRFGAPSAQDVDGSRVVMAFDVGQGSKTAPLLSHLGLLAMVLGAGLYASEASRERGLVRAFLEVKDSRSGVTGYFDMAKAEPFEFFQWPSSYVIRSFDRDFKGLGPMIVMEQRPKDQQQGISFPIFKNAPPGFDARHRDGQVEIRALRMGFEPAPGAGLADSPLAALMLGGLALLILGATLGQRARGRLWLDDEGRRVRLVGVPALEGDVDFERQFQRWALTAESTLQPER